MVVLFLSVKYFFSKNLWRQRALWLGVLGLSLGVGTLIFAMAVISGFEQTLEKSLTDSFGHATITKRSWAPKKHLVESLKNFQHHVDKISPFIVIDGVATHNKKVSGVLLEGVETETFSQVLNLKNRFVKGTFPKKGDTSWALVGKGLAQKINLSVGSRFSNVLLVSSKENSYLEKIKLKVIGILDFGNFDYNERFVMTDLRIFQKAFSKPHQVSGLRLKLKDSEYAEKFKTDFLFQKGLSYHVTYFKERYRNLFEAVKIQKMTLFFVLMLMVLIAAFNISSLLYVGVVQKYSNISLLKSMGLSQNKITLIFCFQGLFIGVVGSLWGVVLGFLGGLFFEKAQGFWSFLPSRTYHLSRMEVHFEVFDVTLVVLSSLFICFLVSYAPSLKGARTPIIKGLLYE